MRYVIVAGTQEEVEERVTARLRRGWEVSGSLRMLLAPDLIHNIDIMWYAQAMISYKEEQIPHKVDIVV
jgi:hypothetical protein